MNDNPTPEPFEINEPGGPAGAPDDTSKTLAGLSYISQFILPAVMPIVLLLSESRYNGFVRYHAVHSLALLIASIIYNVLIFGVISILGGISICLAVPSFPLFLVPVFVVLYYGVKAFRGEQFEIPYLTRFLQQNGWV